MNKRNQRRIRPLSRFVGANFRTSIPFKKLREVYGDELEKYSSKIKVEPNKKRILTPREKNELKATVKNHLQQEQAKDRVILLITLILVFAFLSWIVYFFSIKVF